MLTLVPADGILKSKLPTALLGAAIGNGWIDGRSQYPAYLEYAVKHGLIEENSDVCAILLPSLQHLNLLSRFTNRAKERQTSV